MTTDPPHGAAPPPERPTPPPDEVVELDAERRPRPESGRPALRLGSTGIAWAVALGADLLQILAFPFFVEGAGSPINDVLDIAVALVLIRLIGWHWAFLPTVIAELIPGVDLVPSWTAAVFIATRGRSQRPPAAP